uniref:hypothetical protein n=1 Tax=Akkermansia sp. TaxID=1872421 RepID=UPI003AB3EC3B
MTYGNGLKRLMDFSLALAALVLLSEDLSPKSRKEIVRIAQQYEIRWFDAPFQMGDIDRLLHKRAGILAVSDEGFVRM